VRHFGVVSDATAAPSGSCILLCVLSHFCACHRGRHTPHPTDSPARTTRAIPPKPRQTSCPTMPPQPPKAGRWCLTWNNPSRTWAEINCQLEELVTQGKLKLAAGQLEVGESGTLHLQAYIHLSSQMRRSQVCSLLCMPGVHLEPAKGNEAQCVAYCSKTETRVDGPCLHGVQSHGQGHRSDITALREAVRGGATDRDIVESDELLRVWARTPRLVNAMRVILAPQRTPEVPVTVWVLWGVPGTGKSLSSIRLTGSDATTQRYTVMHANTNGQVWFDGYCAQEWVAFDDFPKGGLRLGFMKTLLDNYPMNVEVKGGVIPMLCTHFIITSNFDPATWFSQVYESDKTAWPAIARRITGVIEYTADSCLAYKYESPSSYCGGYPNRVGIDRPAWAQHIHDVSQPGPSGTTDPEGLGHGLVHGAGAGAGLGGELGGAPGGFTAGSLPLWSLPQLVQGPEMAVAVGSDAECGQGIGSLGDLIDLTPD